MSNSNTYTIIALLWLNLCYQQTGWLAIASSFMALGNFIAACFSK